MVSEQERRKEAFRKDPWGHTCAVVKKDGLTFLRPWNNDTIIGTDLLDVLLDDMGVGLQGTKEDPEIRAVTREFCLEKFTEDEKHNEENAGYTSQELEGLVWWFVYGYRAALRREPKA